MDLKPKTIAAKLEKLGMLEEQKSENQEEEQKSDDQEEEKQEEQQEEQEEEEEPITFVEEMLDPNQKTDREPLILASFAHKGGVGKTTGTHNIGCILAREFKLRVLLIDADPQCSLTGVILRSRFKKKGQQLRAHGFRDSEGNPYVPGGLAPDDEEEKVDGSENNGNEELDEEIEEEEEEEDEEVEVEDVESIEEALNEDGQTEDIVNHPIDIEEENADNGEEYFYEHSGRNIPKTISECFLPPNNRRFSTFVNEPEIKERITQIRLQHLKEFGDLFFLPGDSKINNIEDHLYQSFTHGKTEGTEWPYVAFPGLLTRVFREVAKLRSIDVIVLDLNPGTTALNRALVMGCNYFFISSLTDYYSRRALDTISDVLKGWDHLVKFTRNSELTSEFFCMPEAPKFLGHLFNRVKLGSAKPPADKERKINMTESKLIKSLLPISNLSDNFSYYLSPLVKEFDRFNDQAIEEGVPITFANLRHIRKTHNGEVRDFLDQSHYYRNCYYTTIMTIFSNLSNGHHLQLGDRFKMNPEALQGTLNAVADENATFTGTLPSNLSLHFQIIKKDKTRRLEIHKSAYEEYGKTGSYNLNNTIELIFLNAQFDREDLEKYQKTKRDYEKDLEKYLKLKRKYDLTKEKIVAMLPTFNAAIRPLVRSKNIDNLQDLDKLVLISQIAAPRRKKAPEKEKKQQKKAHQFLNLHRYLTQKWIKLQDFLKSLIPQYKSLMENRVSMPLQKDLVINYAKKLKLNVRIWKINNDDALEFIERQLFGPKSAKVLDILLVPNNVKLLRVKRDDSMMGLEEDDNGPDSPHTDHRRDNDRNDANDYEPHVSKKLKTITIEKTKPVDKKKNQVSKDNKKEEATMWEQAQFLIQQNNEELNSEKVLRKKQL